MLVDQALAQAEEANAELRELAHGILPSVLTRGGLRAGVETVVARIELPIDVGITDERFPPEIEASAYFHRGRGAHQRREAFACEVGRGHGVCERRRVASRGPRRRNRGQIRPATGSSDWPTVRPRWVGGWRSRALLAAARS